MGDQPRQEPSDFYGTSGPATPPGGAWPPPPLWRPVVPSSRIGRRDEPPVEDPFPVPGGRAKAPPLPFGRRHRRSRKHLVGYPLTAVTAVAAGLGAWAALTTVTSPAAPGSPVSPVAQPASPEPAPAPVVTRRTKAAAPVTTRTTKAAAPAPSPSRRLLVADPTTAPAFYADCGEARAAGAAPLSAQDPGYREALDKDDDGNACE